MDALCCVVVQGKGSPGHEVVLAVVELVDALWSQKYSTATRHMQAKEEFCNALTCPIISHKPGTAHNLT